MKHFFKRGMVLCMVAILTLGIAGCSRRAQTEDIEQGPLVGNGDEASVENTYVDAAPEVTTGPLGNSETDESEDYIDAGYTPVYYSSIDEIPEATYCIAHLQTNEDGSQSYIYYPAYDAYGVYGTISGAFTQRPDRYIWTKLGWDDPVIPTMYEGDLFIFKSANVVPQSFALERFSDEGYTIGMTGLQLAASGNYYYSYDNSALQPDSDTINMAALGAQDIFFVSIGDTRVSINNVSAGGSITGLSKNKNYVCDIRTGTARNEVKFRANIHLYSSLEQYMLRTFYFSSPYTIELSFEPSMKTGYYCLNGTGLFRYITKADMGREAELKAEDYNEPFLTLDEEGHIISTIDSLAINEGGFIVKREIAITQ